MTTRQTTLLLLAVLLLFAAGAREKIAHHIQGLTFLEKLGVGTFVFSVVLLIALRALGIIDIIQIISSQIK